MKLRKIVEIIDGDILAGEAIIDDIDCKEACGCDLMSDVLAFTKEKALLLTGLTNLQVIRTAEVADLLAVVFVRGKRPEDEVLSMAEKAEIPLLTTKYPLYETSGLLWSAGLAGCMTAPDQNNIKESRRGDGESI